MYPPQTPLIELPRQRGAVTVRQGGLDDDLDALHVGDPLWWGKDFVAERIASSPPGTPYMMLIGEVDGRPVAHAFLLALGIRAQGFAMGDVFVLPAARGRGVGQALVEALSESTRLHGLPGWSTSVHEDDAASIATAEHWGFERAGHHRESVLDLDALDLDVAETAVRKAEADGLCLTPLPDDADDAAWHSVYDFLVTVWRDAPDAAGATEEMPYSVFRGFFPHPSFVLMAWRGDEPVGVTCVMDRAKDQAINTFFTGVAIDARGAGLSTALKAKHALFLRDLGHHRLYTQNMDQNAPILAANDRLGFRVDTGFYDLALGVGSA